MKWIEPEIRWGNARLAIHFDRNDVRFSSHTYIAMQLNAKKTLK